MTLILCALGFFIGVIFGFIFSHPEDSLSQRRQVALAYGLTGALSFWIGYSLFL